MFHTTFSTLIFLSTYKNSQKTIDSPFIDTIETIYNNSEKQILEVQKEYNKTLHINDITNIIQQEQKKVLDVSNQTILYNDVTNEQYEKMGYIQNKIEILE